MINIVRTDCDFVRENLLAPFGFKGGYIEELWQVIVGLESSAGKKATGLGVQSVLWSDSSEFVKSSQAGGNSLMFTMTEYALKRAKETQFDIPVEMFDQLFPEVFEYGKLITRNKELRATFALNSLVALDNAAWLLYCLENNIRCFDDMIPSEVKPALSYKHEMLAAIPLVSYAVGDKEMKSLTDNGYSILKIKIGSDPCGNGDLEKMLEWDKQRLSWIHEAVGNLDSPYTDSGKIVYYLDANGRYDTKDRLLRFLDHADSIGALDCIILLEEPFTEKANINVEDIPVRIAADESVHSDKDTLERIELGYSAIALKPIAKTLSMSFKIVKTAYEKNIPCFCADLTVNPILVDWNKNLAARIAPIPGVKIGILESNGYQNYSNWSRMKEYHPRCGAEWIDIKDGLFILGQGFYNESGGIYMPSSHYDSLLVY